MIYLVIALWVLGAIPSILVSEAHPNDARFFTSLLILIIFWPLITIFGLLRAITRASA